MVSEWMANFVVSCVASLFVTGLIAICSSVLSSRLAEWNLVLLLLRGRLKGATLEKWVEILGGDWDDAEGPLERVEVLLAAVRLAANSRRRAASPVAPEIATSEPRVVSVEFSERAASRWKFEVRLSNGQIADVELNASHYGIPATGGSHRLVTRIGTNVTFDSGWRSCYPSGALGSLGRGCRGHRMPEAVAAAIADQHEAMERAHRIDDDGETVLIRTGLEQLREFTVEEFARIAASPDKSFK